ncbi:MAG TPA: hypothetical protein VNW29_01765 [Candidatus Sulfotelmatobacter sp.]|jgi:hypothetical protein|nr:hypothetical protein [Candidatus Sulfotelmatobacter sp.]
MKIFISHSRAFNYREELYKPLRNSELNKKHEIIFPHEDEQERETKDSIRDADLVVAEVSFPSTGEGIELGWANASYVSIICFYKSGSKISNALQHVTADIFVYDSMDSMIAKITEFVDAL